MKNLLIVIVLTNLAIHLNGQSKFEKEVRVQEKFVPEQARNFVRQLEPDSRVKWYRETGFNQISFEAKTKINKKLHSIEFAADGSFEDVEVVIKDEEVPVEVYENIVQYLHEKHEKQKVLKLQVQYSGNESLVIESVKNNTIVKGITVRYEVVVSTRSEGEYEMVEYLFTDHGFFIKSAGIVMQNSDNIEF